MNRYMFLSSVAVICLVSADGSGAGAKELTATPDSIRQQVAALQPGDTLRLPAGTYPGGIWLKGLHGRANAPITIRGEGDQTVLTGKPGTNTVDVTDCQWLVIRDLKFDGRGQPVDAIKAGKDSSRGCHHVTIENNLIVNHGADQQIVGISTKSPCSDWIIRGNTILGAGTGMYLGNSDGSQPFVRGVIEYNLVSDPIGYCLQIKHQEPRPPVEALPREPCTTILRYNVFIKADRPSPDGDRPNVLLGGFPDSGPGAEDRYQVYGNLFFHNPRESLIQATGRFSLHDNVFADAPGTAITIMPHAGHSPKQVYVYRNTFVQVGRAVSVSGAPSEGLVVAANLAIGEAQSSRPWPEGNRRLTADEAKPLFYAPTAQLGRLDVQPRRPLPCPVPADILTLLRQDADFDCDFWGHRREPLEQAGACQASQQPRPIDGQRRTPDATP